MTKVGKTNPSQIDTNSFISLFNEEIAYMLTWIVHHINSSYVVTHFGKYRNGFVRVFFTDIRTIIMIGVHNKACSFCSGGRYLQILQNGPIIKKDL